MKFLKIIIILVLFNLNNSQVYSIEPDVFVQSTVNRAAEALGGNASIEEKVQILKDIANETVDVRGIGFYSLGAHRKGLSKDKLVTKTFYDRYQQVVLDLVRICKS